ncbi:LysR family transcriptional regulator [Paraburkholderia sp. MMS20-SJTN17]|uniref:LysR family transcriptional regulator n=1 Tax=Paraburkholderia translucens TaxID=2886945 RepID=A0ABS8KDE4_9BURK|nr:LysR family transcriptional regulator [Paraburkholderia sp. MMS20-SJTN17]MCC8402488.1 LysR family transcriptional regulator [Paraburkholderia sp. MMS20-SJTN17]
MEILSYMRLFVEVARTKSFRRAAEILEIPNSTLSRHIAELEKTIGLRLLNRSTRKVELTEAGEVYFKRCQSIVEEAQIAHELLLEVAERPTGTLRVSMPADLATGYFAPIIADFAKTYPLIAFEFDLSPHPVNLLAEPFDLAIRVGPPPSAPSTLVARPIAMLPRYLYASPEYLKHAAPLTHPNDLDRHVVCIVEGPARLGRVARTFHRGDESVDVMIGTRFAMNSVALSRALALRAVGLAVLDNVLASDDLALGRLVRVLPDWSLSPVLVHAVTETRLLPARARLFIDFLKVRLGVPALHFERSFDQRTP